MAVTRIDITTFLSLKSKYPVIDVRSEGEYNHAHIPGAYSIPLFNNEERRIVGTAYKQESKQNAIKLGLQLIGQKLVQIVEAVEIILKNCSIAENVDCKTIIVYCWRGGMRSGGVAWLLDLYGFKVYTIVGGYKSFRRWSVEQFAKDYPIKVLAGYTGSGKSYVLQEMRKQGQLLIDLEDLAKHKGSAFGNIGMPGQPTQEMFENLLALELNAVMTEIGKLEIRQEAALINNEKNASHFAGGSISDKTDAAIWIEDESQRIGLVNIPILFFDMMRNKPIYFLNIPFEERLKHIVADYGKGNTEELVAAIKRIEKRLGGLETKTAINYLVGGNLVESSRILLKYYDKYYLKGLHKRENLKELLKTIDCDHVDAAGNAQHIIAQEN